MCAILVLQRSKFDSSKQALYELHWLPIKARILFKLLTFMYKFSNDEAPTYLTELRTKHIPNRQGLRSCGSNMTPYDVLFNKRKAFSDLELQYGWAKTFELLASGSYTIEFFRIF
ncbi:hypothetical protein DPMN_053093 [Dreissena polymorpha]|uniref:Uncharacterized protein n=1 Tax=Dreissena polymorpha TaxID=45954 RepID=A0A9D4HQC7_DREPO|nr:hypothetical protein DPMN_053093 [Dreissena polymorpha]